MTDPAQSLLRVIVDLVNQSLLTNQEILQDALQVINTNPDPDNLEAARTRYHEAFRQIQKLESRLLCPVVEQVISGMTDKQRRNLINEIYWTRWGVRTKMLTRMFDDPAKCFTYWNVVRPGRVPHRCLSCGDLGSVVVAGRSGVTELAKSPCRFCGGTLEIDYRGITPEAVDYTR